MWDTAPDSILHQLSERDRTDNTDEFGIWFSPFNDGLNASAFEPRQTASKSTNRSAPMEKIPRGTLSGT